MSFTSQPFASSAAADNNNSALVKSEAMRQLAQRQSAPTTTTTLVLPTNSGPIVSHPSTSPLSSSLALVPCVTSGNTIEDLQHQAERSGHNRAVRKMDDALATRTAQLHAREDAEAAAHWAPRAFCPGVGASHKYCGKELKTELALETGLCATHRSAANNYWSPELVAERKKLKAAMELIRRMERSTKPNAKLAAARLKTDACLAKRGLKRHNLENFINATAERRDRTVASRRVSASSAASAPVLSEVTNTAVVSEVTTDDDPMLC